MACKFMITSSLIRSIGYTRVESGIIMQKLKALNIPFKTIKMRDTYVKRGIVCDYMHFCNGFARLEVIKALKAYCDTKPLNVNMPYWKELLKKLQEVK